MDTIFGGILGHNNLVLLGNLYKLLIIIIVSLLWYKMLDDSGILFEIRFCQRVSKLLQWSACLAKWVVI